MKSICIITATLAVLAAAACTPDLEATDIEIPNPASAYCVQQGGRVEIRQEAAGKVGYCHLSDGRMVEERGYFQASQD